MLTVVEKVISLQNVDVFAQIPTEQLSYLAAIASEESFAESETVYETGEPSDALYVVLDGRVRIHRGEEEIAVAEANESFGTWALFDEETRVATATAIEDSKMLRISREDFIDLLSDHVQITSGVMRTLVRRLRGLLDRVGADLGRRPS